MKSESSRIPTKLQWPTFNKIKWSTGNHLEEAEKMCIRILESASGVGFHQHPITKPSVSIKRFCKLPRLNLSCVMLIAASTKNQLGEKVTATRNKGPGLQPIFIKVPFYHFHFFLCCTFHFLLPLLLSFLLPIQLSHFFFILTFKYLHNRKHLNSLSFLLLSLPLFISSTHFHSLLL